MEIFLKGYYGYKNLGDEILLLWVLNFLVEKHQPTKIYIQSQYPLRLSSWLSRHCQLLSLSMQQIVCVDKKFIPPMDSFLVIWGGEVLTDARPFPYNGRNYILKHPIKVFRGKFALLGGIWAPRTILSKCLYTCLLGRAAYVVTREKVSFAVAATYTNKVELYHDFSEDILELFSSHHKTWSKILININPYIWNTASKDTIYRLVGEHPELSPRYISWDIVQDTPYFYQLQEKVPTLQLFDRTNHTLDEILEFFDDCALGVAARLHVLFLLRWGHKEMYPLAYQEKIEKFFGKQ